MNATEKEKVDMNTPSTTNQRLVTILLVLLIVLVALLVVGVIVSFLTMGSMMGGGMMFGMNGQTMNNMMSACTEMMKNIQKP
jgi:flagellar basal body-associated protein FliL